MKTGTNSLSGTGIVKKAFVTALAFLMILNTLIVALPGSSTLTAFAGSDASVSAADIVSSADADVPETTEKTLQYALFTYESVSGGIAITGCESSLSGVVEIPAEIDGLPVVAIGNCAFSGCDGITEVILPESVESIGNCAFSGCSQLNSITIPNTSVTIGVDAFSGCSGVSIPNIGSGGLAAAISCPSPSEPVVPSTPHTVEPPQEIVTDSGLVLNNGEPSPMYASGAGDWYASYPDSMMRTLKNGMTSFIEINEKYDNYIDISDYDIIAYELIDVLDALEREYPVEYAAAGVSYITYVFMPDNDDIEDNEWVIGVYFIYTSDTAAADYSSRFNALTGKVNGILDAIEGMTTYEKLLYVHDYLVLNGEYDTDLELYEAYDILVDGIGVCQAYTLAYQLIMDLIDVPNVRATSDAMNHTWNLVRLDGSWYQIDVTWDDPVPDTPKQVYYVHFLLNDEELAATNHYEWYAAYECNSTLYSDTPRGTNGTQAYYNGRWYSLFSDGDDTTTDYIYSTDIYGGDVQTVCSPASGGIAIYNGVLFYGSGQSIMTYGLNTGSTNTLYTLSDSELAKSERASKNNILALYIDENGILSYRYRIWIISRVEGTTVYYSGSYADGETTIDVSGIEDLVHATSITLSKSSLSINVGNSADVTASVLPENTTDSVKWTTSNSAVATVSGGKITAVAPGTATITATAGEVSATCTVTVLSPATSVSLNKTSMALTVGSSQTLTATVVPANSTDTVVWSTSSSAVATVSNGKVTAVAPGTATITATAGEVSATCVVTVTAPATGISLDKSTLTIAVGSSSTLVAAVTPSNSTDAVVWSTSASAVATVSNGKVTAVAPGTATITAKAGNYSATCVVTVTAPATGITLDKTSITLIEGRTGTLTAVVTPSNTTDKVVWSTTNSGVVQVNNGTLTAVRPGTATVTATAGSVSASCTVTVIEPAIRISLEPASMTLLVSRTADITATVTPASEAANIVWTTSNSAVATVSDGKVTAVGVGSATITATIEDYYAVCQVTVNPLPLSILQQPADVTVSDGQTAEVSFTAEGEGLTYKWYFANKGSSKFTLTTTFTGNTYSLEMNTARDGRQVYCVVTDKYGDSVTTDTVTLSMKKTPLAITQQPADVSVALGETAAAAVVAEGDGLTYEWYYAEKGSGTFKLTTSFTGNTYSIEMTTARDGRQVYCVITDRYGNSVKSDIVTLSAEKTALRIITQPADVTVGAGETAAATVDVQGDGLTYKWYYAEKGSGTFKLTTTFTGDTYSIEMTAARDGRQVYCVITDAYGDKITTDTVTLSIVKTPLQIVTQPADAAVYIGETAAATVGVQGDGLTYKWYYAEKGSSTFKLTTSFTGDTYSVEMNSARNGRRVYCVITDAYGDKVTSEIVTLSIVPTPLVITTQPADVKVADGQSLTISLTAAGDGLTYAWYYANAGETEFTLTTSFTGTKYTTTMSDARDGRRVYCVVTDQYNNSVQSDVAVMSMGTKLTITEQPANCGALIGEMASATVKADGDGLTYKWYFAEKGSSTFKLTTSFTGDTYSIEMTAARDGRRVYCVVTDQYGKTVTSKTVTLSKMTPFAITQQPVDTTVADGQDLTVSLKATGDGLTYKWYYANAGETKFTLTTSFTGTKYTTTMNDARDGRRIYCVVTDKYGNTDTTDIVTISMGTKITITQQPEDTHVQLGETANVTVKANGDGLTYKWYFAEKGSSTFKLTTSFTGDTYSIEMTAARDGRRVYCVVTDRYGKSVKSNIATMTKYTPLAILTQPVDTCVKSGANAVVKFTVQGDGLTYKWYYAEKGTNEFKLTTSFTGNTYSVAMNDARDGRRLYCVVTDKYGNSVTTDTVTILKATV